MTRTRLRNDHGYSILEVLFSLFVMSFTSAIIIVGANAMTRGAETAMLNHQLDQTRAAMETLLMELSDAGPAHGFCVDDPATADDELLNPDTPLASCRTFRSAPFQLLTASDEQVCFFGRSAFGTEGPEVTPDMVCIRLAFGTLIVERTAGTGDWTDPSWDESNPRVATVLGNIDPSAVIRYYDDNGNEIPAVPPTGQTTILPLPTNTNLRQIALVEVSLSVTDPTAGGDVSSSLMFNAPLRANLFTAGD